jgi:hypothetical protein
VLEVAVAPVRIGDQSFGSASVSPSDARLVAAYIRAYSEFQPFRGTANQMSNERVERKGCASPSPLPSRRSGLEGTRKSSDNA